MKALAIVCVLAGCDWQLHRMQESVSCTVHGATALLPRGTCDQPPPDGIVAMQRPLREPAVTRALLSRGRDRYERICAACHGIRADGVSQVARVMTIRRPPSLVDPQRTLLTDDHILVVMERGYGVMPPYRWLAGTDRYAILHYVRALQGSVLALDQLEPSIQAEARRWLH
jgi:mono/diheme cytochrome c family protein